MWSGLVWWPHSIQVWILPLLHILTSLCSLFGGRLFCIVIIFRVKLNIIIVFLCNSKVARVIEPIFTYFWPFVFVLLRSYLFRSFLHFLMVYCCCCSFLCTLRMLLFSWMDNWQRLSPTCRRSPPCCLSSSCAVLQSDVLPFILCFCFLCFWGAGTLCLEVFSSMIPSSRFKVSGPTFKSLVHFVWFLCRVGEVTSVFCMWISSFPPCIHSLKRLSLRQSILLKTLLN